MSAQLSVVRVGPGCWRTRRDGTAHPGLPAAIAAVRKGYPDRSDLHALAWMLLPRLPGKPRTSANLKEEGALSALAPLEDVVLSDPWLAMNTASAVNVLWAESDKPGFAERCAVLREAKVPISWTTRGTVGGHACIVLDMPVVTGITGQEERDRKRLRKLSLTRSLLTTAIDGDHHAGLRGMTKNPWSARWQTEVHDLVPRTLDEALLPLQAMAEAEGWVAPRRRYRGDRRREPSPEGRNCALFDLVRWWAADGAVRDGPAILAMAEEVNAGFAVPLAHGEVASVARSITRFMVNRYDGRGRHVPLAPEVVKGRQAAAGRATATARAASRGERLLAALDRLQAQGIPPGQHEVAAEAGVSLSTVKAVWGMLWDRIVNNSQYAPPASGSSASLAREAALATPPEALRPDRNASPHPLDVEPAVPPPPVPARWRGNEASRRADRDALAANHAAFARLDPRIVRLTVLPGNGHVQGPIDWSPEAVARRRRQDSRRRCEGREAWHAAAARGGLRAYRDAVAARYAALFRARRQAIEAAEDWPDPEEGVDPRAVMAERERQAGRLRIVRMGWAARMKAEDRISRRWDDELQARERVARPRFRTAPDALDRVAMAIPDPPAEVAARAIRERAAQRTIDAAIRH